jgi:hypothetical protein
MIIVTRLGGVVCKLALARCGLGGLEGGCDRLQCRRCAAALLLQPLQQQAPARPGRPAA